MTVTIHQPEYLPWLPFFDRLQKSDVFVILDDVGYQKNGFINRNKIKTKNGWGYLTVPIIGRSPNKRINEILIDNSKNWQKSQLSVIKENYKTAPYFNDYYNFFEETFSKKWEKISDLDSYLIKKILNFLSVKVKIEVSSEMNIEGIKTEKLVEICKILGADTYLSGPGGKNYMDLELFKKEGIKIVFQEFSNPQYNQQFMEKGFLPGLSVVDLLFNKGPKSLDIIKL